MKFEDVYGDKHKTFFGALKADLKHAYAEKVRKAVTKAMIQDQVEGYESDPWIYEDASSTQRRFPCSRHRSRG